MFDSFFSWMPWLAGGSTIALIALALLAPSVLTVAASYLVALSPIVKAAADFIVEFGRIFWRGAVATLDNASGIVFVATAMAVTYGYSTWNHTHSVKRPVARVSHSCDKVVSDLRRDYIFTPRKGSAIQSSPALPAPATQNSWRDWVPEWIGPN